jgi:hypothetical protein
MTMPPAKCSAVDRKLLVLIEIKFSGKTTPQWRRFLKMDAVILDTLNQGSDFDDAANDLVKPVSFLLTCVCALVARKLVIPLCTNLESGLHLRV